MNSRLEIRQDEIIWDGTRMMSVPNFYFNILLKKPYVDDMDDMASVYYDIDDTSSV